MGLSLGDYVVTEAGFERRPQCREIQRTSSADTPVSVRCHRDRSHHPRLRHRGGAKKEKYNTASLERVQKGSEDLQEAYRGTAVKYGLTPVVAINAFRLIVRKKYSSSLMPVPDWVPKLWSAKASPKAVQGTMSLARGCGRYDRKWCEQIPSFVRLEPAGGKTKIRTIAKESLRCR